MLEIPHGIILEVSLGTLPLTGILLWGWAKVEVSTSLLHLMVIHAVSPSFDIVEQDYWELLVLTKDSQLKGQPQEVHLLQTEGLGINPSLSSVAYVVDYLGHNKP